MSNRLRVLIIAEAANPDWISVPLVGWSHARALFDQVDAHLVTQVRNVEAIEKTGFRRGHEFTAIDSEVVARPLWRASEAIRKTTGIGFSFETGMQALPYYYFEHALWKELGGDIRAGKWDIVHRLTPLSPSIPSILAGRVRSAGARFILGPINGGVPWPAGFWETQRREGEWLAPLRGAYRLLPGHYAMHRDAAAVIVGSRTAFSELPEVSRAKAVYTPENAIDERRFPQGKSGPVERPLKVAFVGRLVALKGVDMLIEAGAGLMRAGELILDVIGDGPEREPLRQLAARLGVSHAVKLDGWVEHRVLAQRMMQSDVFGFPSIREFGGGAVLEAMALGLVPIVVDYAGPAELVTARTGYRVPIAPRPTLIEGFAEVLRTLCRDPSGLREMGERARERVLSQFTWPKRAAQTVEIYRWALGQRDKPDFGMPFGD